MVRQGGQQLDSRLHPMLSGLRKLHELGKIVDELPQIFIHAPTLPAACGLQWIHLSLEEMAGRHKLESPYCIDCGGWNRNLLRMSRCALSSIVRPLQPVIPRRIS
jgi:hypothetical protein